MKFQKIPGRAAHVRRLCVPALLAMVCVTACHGMPPVKAPVVTKPAVTEPAAPGPAPYDTPEFSLKLPAGCHIEKRVMVDFDLYYLTTAGPDGKPQDLLGIYAGNAPGFPHTQGLEKHDGTLGGMPAEIVQKSAGGLETREYLVQRKQGGFPARYHLWYTDQTPDRAKLADAILNTFRLKQVITPEGSTP